MFPPLLRKGAFLWNLCKAKGHTAMTQLPLISMENFWVFQTQNSICAQYLYFIHHDQNNHIHFYDKCNVPWSLLLGFSETLGHILLIEEQNTLR